jgi:KUP system potassium uptake protein
MAITNILFYAIARGQWQWSGLKAGSFLAFFMVIDIAFFSSNLLKVPHGGWVPLAIALVVFILMTTWKRGRILLRTKLLDRSLPIDTFVESLGHGGPVRVPGTAIFMTSESEGTPVVLLHHLKHNKVLHEKVILLSIISRQVPEVPSSERITLEPLDHGSIACGPSTASWRRRTSRTFARDWARPGSRRAAWTRRTTSGARS